jgi:hypothetical protein
MVLPMQDKMEEWRKSVTMLDKEHAKEYKKLRLIIDIQGNKRSLRLIVS